MELGVEECDVSSSLLPSAFALRPKDQCLPPGLGPDYLGGAILVCIVLEFKAAEDSEGRSCPEVIKEQR